MEPPQGGHSSMSPRVNFGPRRASIPQLLLSLVIWGGTLALAVTTVWSYTARNVILKIASDCSPCQPGYYPVGKKGCPRLCVSAALEQAIEQTCVRRPMLVTGEDPAEADDGLRFRRLKAELFTNLAASPDVAEKTMLQLLADPLVLPTFLPLILCMAVGWFAVLKRAAKISVYGTVVLFELGLFYGFTLTENWVMLVIMLFVAGWTVYKEKELDEGARCLQDALVALKESPHVLLVVSLNALMMLCYTAMVVSMLVCCSQVWTVSEDKATKDCRLRPLSAHFTAPFTVLFLLVGNFFNMVSGFCISFTIGCWYFHQSDPSAPPVPMIAGMQLALGSKNGTGVCAQAGIALTALDYMEQKMKSSKCPCLDPLWCCISCMYIFFRQFLESISSFALVAVALEGGPLLETSRRAAETLGEARLGRFAVMDASLTWILRAQANALSTVVGVLAWGVIDWHQDLGTFRALVDEASVAERERSQGGQAMFVLVVLAFYTLARRPLSTFVTVVLYQVFIGDFITWPFVRHFMDSVLAALLVGSIASMVLHLFAETARAALASMLYCWSLEEATCGQQGLPSVRRCRQTVVALWEDSSAMLMASAPPMQEVQHYYIGDSYIGGSEAGGGATGRSSREVQMTPAGAGSVQDAAGAA